MLLGKIIITRADERDAETLTELSVTTFRDAFGPDNNREDMDKYIATELNAMKLTAELRDSGNLFFMARIEKIVAGYAKMRASYKPDTLLSNNPIEIERLYVQHQYQGLKIGGALMNHCIEYALSKQYDTLWLGVWQYNHNAINFYQRRGFEIFGSHSFMLGNDNQTDLLMKKELQGDAH